MKKADIDLLMQQLETGAKKRNKVVSFFTKIIDKNYENNQREDLAIAYSDLGSRYKQIGCHDNASQAYEKSAKIYDMLANVDDLFWRDAVEQYLNAGNSCKSTNLQKTVDLYILAIDRCEKGRNYKKAYKIYKDLGNIYENVNELDKSIDVYTKALQCNDVCETNQGMKNEISIKLAELGIKNSDYKYSHDMYLNLINDNVKKEQESSLFKYKMNDLIFRYILCDFILHVETHDNISIAQHIDKLIDKCNKLWPSFEISNQHQLLIDCVHVCANDDGCKIKMFITDKSYVQIFSDPLIKKIFIDLIGFLDAMSLGPGELEVVDLS